jgi:hypothetical protein
MSSAVSVDGGSSSPAAEVTTIMADDIPQAQQSTVMTPPPPLARYAAYFDGPGEDSAYQAARTQREGNIQNAVAACMTAHGFRYEPFVNDSSLTTDDTVVSTMILSQSVPLLSDRRDVVAHDGYGIMATPDEQERAEGMREDPNVVYQATLSPTEADAYSRALYGDYNDPAGTAASSCMGKAIAQFPELNESSRKLAFENEFSGIKRAVIDLVRTDALATTEGMGLNPAVVDLNAGWESCMNTKGYTFEEKDPVRGPMLALDRAVRTKPDGTVGPLRYGVLTSDIPVEEDSLLGTEPERLVALADFDCRVESDYMTRLDAVRVSLDEAFILGHQADLDRLTEAAQSW